MSWKYLCRLDWPWIHLDVLVSVSWVLGRCAAPCWQGLDGLVLMPMRRQCRASFDSDAANFKEADSLVYLWCIRIQPHLQKHHHGQERHCYWRCNDVNNFSNGMLKTFIQDGITCGIHKAAKASGKCQGHHCVFASIWDEPKYIKLVEALWVEHQIILTKVSAKEKVGRWGGLCKADQESKPTNVGSWSYIVVKDYSKESQANDVIKENLKWKKWINETFGSFRKRVKVVREIGDVQERPYLLPEVWLRVALQRWAGGRRELAKRDLGRLKILCCAHWNHRISMSVYFVASGKYLLLFC